MSIRYHRHHVQADTIDKDLNHFGRTIKSDFPSPSKSPGTIKSSDRPQLINLTPRSDDFNKTNCPCSELYRIGSLNTKIDIFRRRRNLPDLRNKSNVASKSPRNISNVSIRIIIRSAIEEETLSCATLRRTTDRLLHPISRRHHNRPTICRIIAYLSENIGSHMYLSNFA